MRKEVVLAVANKKKKQIIIMMEEDFAEYCTEVAYRKRAKGTKPSRTKYIIAAITEKMEREGDLEKVEPKEEVQVDEDIQESEEVRLLRKRLKGPNPE